MYFCIKLLDYHLKLTFMIRNLIILTFSLSFYILNGQSFFKGYPTPDFKKSLSIKSVIAKNNQFIYHLVDYTNHSAILKLNMYGSVVWSKTYNNSTNKLVLKDMIETTDGSIVCIGLIDEQFTDIDSSIIFKINSDGIIQWTLKMGSFFKTNLSSIIELKSSELVVSGTYWYNFNASVTRLYIAKLSSSGIVIWGKSYFAEDFKNLEPYTIRSVVDQTGNIWSIGYEKVHRKGIILCVNSLNGDTILTRQRDSFKSYRFGNIIATQDSNVFISGSTEYKNIGSPLITKFDSKGNPIWSLIKDVTDRNSTEVTDMASIGSSDVLIYLSSYSRLSRIDKNGNLKWSKSPNLNSTIFPSFGNIYTSQYDNIILAGNQYVSLNYYYPSVLKTDSIASLYCYNSQIGIKTSLLPLKYVSFDSLNITNHIDTSSCSLHVSNKTLDTIDLLTKVSFNSPTICLGQYAKIDSDADSCVWPLGFTVLSPKSAKISPTQTTAYNIVSFKGGCDFTNQVTVTVIQTPINNSVSLTGKTLTTSQAGATYQWINCKDKKPITGAMNQSFLPSVNGEYAVITKLGSCIDTSECKSVSISGLSYLTNESINLYPNPIVDNLTIEFTTNIDFLKLGIYNLVGQLLINDVYKNKQSINLNVSNFKNGFYYLVIDDGLTRKNFKLLKE